MKRRNSRNEIAESNLGKLFFNISGLEKPSAATSCKNAFSQKDRRHLNNAVSVLLKDFIWNVCADGLLQLLHFEAWACRILGIKHKLSLYWPLPDVYAMTPFYFMAFAWEKNPRGFSTFNSSTNFSLGSLRKIRLRLNNSLKDICVCVCVYRVEKRYVNFSRNFPTQKNLMTNSFLRF